MGDYYSKEQLKEWEKWAKKVGKMENEQTFLLDWQEMAELNKLKRINWKLYLGKSFNEYISGLVAENIKDFETIEEEIYITVIEKGILEKEDITNNRLIYLIHINVGARMAEISINHKVLGKLK